MSAIEGYLSDLVIARRLLLTSERLTARMKGKDVSIQSAKEAMEEEEKMLDGLQVDKTQDPAAKTPEPQNVDVKLSDLIQRLKTLQENGGEQSQEFAATYTEHREVQVQINYKIWEPVDGLVVRNQHLAETDRYAFEFVDGVTLKITDKWSGKSTTVWGDPHVDTSDQEGTSNGEFSDLKSSDAQTTFMLEDGTRLTFTARDTGVIEKIDIFKGNQHVTGLGSGSKDYNEKTGLFNTKVLTDATQAKSSLAVGDVVYAGGDGNDWFDAAGRMVWGKTTGPKPSYRPYATMEIMMQERVEQSFTMHAIDRQA